MSENIPNKLEDMIGRYLIFSYYAGGPEERKLKKARVPILEAIQDEMLDAARQRGTR